MACCASTPTLLLKIIIVMSNFGDVVVPFKRNILAKAFFLLIVAENRSGLISQCC